MSIVIEQIPIRMQLGVISDPPTSPVDRNTGDIPRAWVAAQLEVDIGIFDQNSVGVDLTNIAYLQVILQEAVDSDVAVAVIQINAADITKVITIGAWQAGTAQNAKAIFTPADTGVALKGAASRNFWCVVQGVTNGGAPIVYGAGAFAFFNPGGTIPRPVPVLTSRHAQASNVNDITVTPTTQIHTEVITIGGAARTVNVLLGIIGIQDGAVLHVIFVLPATANILLNVKNVVAGNPVISTFGTGDVLQAMGAYYFDANAAAWKPLQYAVPAP